MALMTRKKVKYVAKSTLALC